MVVDDELSRPVVVVGLEDSVSVVVEPDMVVVVLVGTVVVGTVVVVEEVVVVLELVVVVVELSTWSMVLAPFRTR